MSNTTTGRFNDSDACQHCGRRRTVSHRPSCPIRVAAEIAADIIACEQELLLDIDAAHGHAVQAFNRAESFDKGLRSQLAELVATLEDGLVGLAQNVIDELRA